MKTCSYCGAVPPTRKVGKLGIAGRHTAPCGLPCWYGLRSDPKDEDDPSEVHGSPTKLGSGSYACPRCGPVTGSIS